MPPEAPRPVYGSYGQPPAYAAGGYAASAASRPVARVARPLQALSARASARPISAPSASLPRGRPGRAARAVVAFGAGEREPLDAEHHDTFAEVAENEADVASAGGSGQGSGLGPADSAEVPAEARSFEGARSLAGSSSSARSHAAFASDASSSASLPPALARAVARASARSATPGDSRSAASTVVVDSEAFGGVGAGGSAVRSALASAPSLWLFVAAASPALLATLAGGGETSWGAIAGSGWLAAALSCGAAWAALFEDASQALEAGSRRELERRGPSLTLATRSPRTVLAAGMVALGLAVLAAGRATAQAPEMSRRLLQCIVLVVSLRFVPATRGALETLAEVVAGIVAGLATWTAFLVRAPESCPTSVRATFAVLVGIASAASALARRIDLADDEAPAGTAPPRAFGDVLAETDLGERLAPHRLLHLLVTLCSTGAIVPALVGVVPFVTWTSGLCAHGLALAALRAASPGAAPRAAALTLRWQAAYVALLGVGAALPKIMG